MIEASLINANDEEQFIYSIVPLQSGFLCQASLFDEKTYPLPKVVPGETAVIVDADEWGNNFKKGTVRSYNYFTGVHAIQIHSVETLDCYGREIRKALHA